MITSRTFCTLGLLFGAIAAQAAAPAPRYSVTDIGILPGYLSTVGHSIDSLGEVAGYCYASENGTLYLMLSSIEEVNLSISGRSTILRYKQRRTSPTSKAKSPSLTPYRLILRSIPFFIKTDTSRL